MSADAGEKQHLTMHPPTLMVGSEPVFVDVCNNESDRMILRNIVYTIWALNKDCTSTSLSSSPDTSSFSTSCYVGYNIKRVENKGYVILAFFARGYSIALQASSVCTAVFFHRSQ